MKKLTFTNFAVFILFFGVAAVEAIQTRNWLKVVFWFAIGLVFLMADLRKKKEKKSINVKKERKRGEKKGKEGRCKKRE